MVRTSPVPSGPLHCAPIVSLLVTSDVQMEFPYFCYLPSPFFLSPLARFSLAQFTCLFTNPILSPRISGLITARESNEQDVIAWEER